MIYVLDASAVVDLLVRSDWGERVREFLAAEPEPLLLTVAHLDAEVFSGLARNYRAGLLDAEEVTGLLQRLGSLAMGRVPITAELLEVAW
ncbi:MAG: VapC toxin family PIN domain ribonuclease, partial [Pseudonocardiaceae bacterium]|nr:VapC toxin family PIN domain ribonuclease [Pseudonocardiaceae bacterium]